MQSGGNTPLHSRSSAHCLPSAYAASTVSLPSLVTTSPARPASASRVVGTSGRRQSWNDQPDGPTAPRGRPSSSRPSSREWASSPSRSGSREMLGSGGDPETNRDRAPLHHATAASGASGSPRLPVRPQSARSRRLSRDGTDDSGGIVGSPNARLTGLERPFTASPGVQRSRGRLASAQHHRRVMSPSRPARAPIVPIIVPSDTAVLSGSDAGASRSQRRPNSVTAGAVLPTADTDSLGNDGGEVPVTLQQQRLLSAHTGGSRSDPYSECLVQGFVAAGTPDALALEVSLRQVMKLHALIQVRIDDMTATRANMIPAAPAALEAPVLQHLVVLPDELDDAIAAAGRRTFPLGPRDPCVTATLLESTAEFALVLVFPTVIFDLFSAALFVKQLWEQ